MNFLVHRSQMIEMIFASKLPLTSGVDGYLRILLRPALGPIAPHSGLTDGVTVVALKADSLPDFSPYHYYNGKSNTPSTLFQTGNLSAFSATANRTGITAQVTYN